MAKLTEQDKKWQAEGDADTLIRAQEILNDAGRKSAANVILKKRSEAAQDARQQLEKKTAERIKEFKGK